MGAYQMLLFNSNLFPILLLFITFVLFLLYHRKQNSKNLPPGPPGIPVFGNLLQLKDKNLIEELAKYRKQYGDIFKVQIGFCTIIVVNGYDLIKEVFQTRGDEFYNRPGNFLNLHLSKHRGIITSNHQNWKEQRAFGTSTLRHFGVGRKNIEIPIREECECLINEIKKKHGRSFSMKRLIQNATANIICSISFGKRHDYNDKKFTDLAHFMDEFIKNLGSLGQINAFPFMQYFPWDVFNQKQIISSQAHLRDYMKMQIEEHKNTLDEADPRDLIDFYIIEMKKNSSNDNCLLNEDQLTHILLDFFIAGTDTTAVVVCWAIVYLVHYPSIQKKLHEEIDLVIGSTIPKMEDKKNTPYMSAFIEEVLRIAIIAPLAFEHAPSGDKTINGLFIPKGIVIVPNLHSAAHDPQVFPEPEKFIPERFLDADGSFHASEKSIPFSIGRRVCLGESLAKTEIFLFLTSFLQHFEFLESEEGLPSLQGVFAGNYAPLPYTIKAMPRM